MGSTVRAITVPDPPRADPMTRNGQITASPTLSAADDRPPPRMSPARLFRHIGRRRGRPGCPLLGRQHDQGAAAPSLSRQQDQGAAAPSLSRQQDQGAAPSLSRRRGRPGRPFLGRRCTAKVSSRSIPASVGGPPLADKLGGEFAGCPRSPAPAVRSSGNTPSRSIYA
ncbi:hypothetical protein KSP39_PZI001550 [Platanthera zijinensis]|uniref:Uncharacterized protein n=1 Tax=Platanthera zijinensis TaxID=2320716 RepID=A0AAP0C475_9ASPA